ncbi:chemotaxis response regulator protein-glutamate methylesterase [bacterium]|nr:chemotaxis response regulator protein-glutamate methylesterase [bacterium]
MNMIENRPIKVFIVDDSLLMRTLLTKLIEDSPELTLVGTASDGKTALDLIAKTNPDVITMDIEMPEMNGLECLSRIMKEMPTPVIMISAHTQEETELTITALELGAVDFIPKPHPILPESIEEIKKKIYIKIRTADLIDVKKIDPQMVDAIYAKTQFPKNRSSSSQARRVIPCKNVISIGVSTGGPKALSMIIPTVPADINASILIVQHMPARFTKALAKRLDELSEVEVREAKEGDPLVSGKVFIARGDYHLTIERNSHTYFTSLNQEERVSSFRPSIDVLMRSTAHHFKKKNIGVIMSGMCSDGVEGIRHIKENQGTVIAQDEATSTIFGMNKIAIQMGLVDKVVSLDQIVPTILNQL